jgi:hypothetical protein
MNSYELSRSFTDWSFENPEKIKPIHYAIYFFAIEHCNRLGWKSKFGLPSQMVMESIGVKNWRTYSSGLNDLVEWGFISMVEVSKNQYSSNIISLSATVKNTKADTKALDKALSKHSQKQHTKQSQSIVSIDKQLNNLTKNNLTKNNKGGVIMLPFDSDIFFDVWCNWKEYQSKEFKFSYKSNISEQAALKKLFNISEQNEDTAIKIITQSIESTWKGFFKIKLEHNGKQTSETGKQLIEQLANSDLWKGA